MPYLTVCVGEFPFSCTDVNIAWPGLPKDVWELSQMFGQGGRYKSQAAFVILLWVSQADSQTILSLLHFISFLFDQEAVVQARL